MTLPLIPNPAATTTGDTDALAVRDGMAVVVPSPDLLPTVRRFIDDVRTDAGVALALSAEPVANPAITVALDTAHLDSIAPAGGLRADGASPIGSADERHRITIDADGIRVWAATTEGIHRGLTSVRQLLTAAARGGEASLSPATILDGPRFAWRGLSLDVARTFHEPATVRRVIDMCSLYKLNVLHLHLTDDQGWRVEIPARPALTTGGDGHYTPADMRDLVAYAAERFVTLVPEIDMPGHTGAIFQAYPELAPTGADLDGFAAATLDPGRDETWEFVEDVLDAVIPQFPQSAYLHVGGDEAFGMADDAHAAFVERAIELVRRRGRRTVGWQEIARATLSPDDVVQYWMDTRDTEAFLESGALDAVVPPEFMSVIREALPKAEADVPSALARGNRLLISPTSRLYYDRPHAAPSWDADQEELRARVGLPIYPPLSLRDGVDWDPVDDTPGLDADDAVAGIEAAIWCETIKNREELEFMLLPRLGGIAEKAWSRHENTDWADYVDRLAPQRIAWDARGWTWFRSREIEWALTPG